MMPQSGCIRDLENRGGDLSGSDSILWIRFKGSYQHHFADYDDYSNGMAGWTEANIVIWVPDSRFDLRSSTTWLRNVITHEIAHIISLESKEALEFLLISDLKLPMKGSLPGHTSGVSHFIPHGLPRGSHRLRQSRWAMIAGIHAERWF